VTGDETTVIDLGPVEPSWSDDAVWLAGPRWRYPRHIVRRLLLSAVAALTLATVGAAAPVHRVLVPTLAVRLDEALVNLAVDAETLYVLSGQPPRAELAAYRLADGAMLWRVPVGLPGFPGLGLVDVGGVLVVIGATGVPGDAGYSASSIGFDEANGAAVWRREGGIVVGPTAAGALLVIRDRPQATQRRGHSVDIQAVRASSGEPVWTVRLASQEVYPRLATDWLGTRGSTRLATLDGDGVLRTHDLATGRTLAERRFGEPGAYPDIVIANGAVLVRSVTAPVFRAYGVDDLMPRWSADVLSESAVAPCGEFVCLPTAGGLHAVDPATGALAWVRADLFTAGELGPPWPGATLLGWSSDRVTSELVDGRTGRTIVDLGRWAPFGAPDGRAYLMISQPSGPGAGVAWLGRFRPRLETIEPLAAVPGVDSCLNGGDYLVCHSGVDRVQAWRVRD
jgi:hypothetical protein